MQVLYIDHDKAKDCEELILDVNAVPAAFSKGLLDQPHPGNSIAPTAMDAIQAEGDNSDLSDDEVAEAGAKAGGAETEGDRAGDGPSSKL